MQHRIRFAVEPPSEGVSTVTQSDSTPTVEVLLQGFSLDTNVGLAGFCMVTLVEGLDANGDRKRILFDPAHVGRRTMLWDALAKRGLGPTDIDGVVLSHSHWDHIQNIDVFDHAPIMVHPYERAYSLRAAPQRLGNPSLDRNHPRAPETRRGVRGRPDLARRPRRRHARSYARRHWLVGGDRTTACR